MIKRSGMLMMVIGLTLIIAFYGGFGSFSSSMLDWTVSPHLSPLGAMASSANTQAKVFGGTLLYAEEGGRFNFRTDLQQVERILHDDKPVTVNQTSVHIIIHDRDIRVNDFLGQYFDYGFTELAVFNPSFIETIRSSGQVSVALDVTRQSSIEDVNVMGSRSVSRQSIPIPSGKYSVSLLVTCFTLKNGELTDETIVSYKTWSLNIVLNIDNYIETKRGVVDFTIPLLLTVIPIALLVAGIITVAVYWKE